MGALGAPNTPFLAVKGGTLGVGFIAQVDGRDRFLKSYASAEGKPNLEKEFRILTHLYGERLDIRRIEVPGDQGLTRVWLFMDVLRPLDAPLTPGETRSLIETYRAQLASLPANALQTADTLGTLITDAKRGLSNLASAGQIGVDMHHALSARLEQLTKKWQSFSPCICHGDLGPRNIMTVDGRPVVIDWEDAFWGVDGYDYLYWLTFFENRRHYNKDILGHTQLGTEVEVTLLAMILLLKSDLSLRANTLVGNQITVEQRIGEVVALA
ncbi:aminoglycoside phosphotransferase family protein [Paraburkholderia piptadeniae]|uniref:aminoglycoside phosphotransferase family protein n=1 Tax=Paraburkholderia piptadeniae TaxID=1701573 RepID=UPI00135A2D18|nr:aminoglycoside phosphotransferase family protein [Paraburkholderia piptadeniae]